MMVFLSTLFAVILLVLAGNQACALEARNLLMGQEGKRAYLQYDLTGRPGEKEADVTVNLEIAGERYGAEKLALSGDMGAKVKVGIARRIWWDLLKDMPAGYDGEVVWNVEATATAKQIEKRQGDSLSSKSPQSLKPEMVLDAKSVPFKALNDVVYDSAHSLMWAKLGDDTTEKFTYDRAVGYVKKMNQDKFGGFDNWRLPDDEDVSKLFASAAAISARSGKTPMKVLLQYFPDLEDWRYWQDFVTSRKYGKGPHYKRSFDIENGTHTGDLADDGLCILPVRNAAAPQTPDQGGRP